MFKILRWRLTIWFVCLSGLVYLGAGILGLIFFQSSLTSALDEELQVLESSLSPAVTYVHSSPTLRNWALEAGLRTRDLTGVAASTVTGWSGQTSLRKFKLRATIELFDPVGKLLEQYGPVRITHLLSQSARTGEVECDDEGLRWQVKPLYIGKQLVGFLQIQLTTHGRDRALQHFALVGAKLAPFLILCLGLVGYWFCGWAVAPIEANYGLFRRFMADAGHELGSPIAIIQANAEALEPELEEKGVDSKRLQFILSTTERMGSIVKDLIYLARTESADGRKKAPLKLNELVSSTTGEFSELFKSSGIEFNYAEIETATVMGDSDSLKRLLTNLLQNALRYTDREGQVTVALKVHGKQAMLCVADTGIGIPPESLPHLFDRFYRVDKSRSRAQGGSGLGLSIVKAICELHNGRITVTSEPGRGSEFNVILPLQS